MRSTSAKPNERKYAGIPRRDTMTWHPEIFPGDTKLSLKWLVIRSSRCGENPAALGSVCIGLVLNHPWHGVDSVLLSVMVIGPMSKSSLFLTRHDRAAAYVRGITGRWLTVSPMPVIAMHCCPLVRCEHQWRQINFPSGSRDASMGRDVGVNIT